MLYLLVKRLSCPFDLGSVIRVASLPLADHGFLDLSNSPGVPLTASFGLVADVHHHGDLTAVRSIEPDVGDAQNWRVLGIGCIDGWWCPAKSEVRNREITIGWLASSGW